MSAFFANEREINEDLVWRGVVEDFSVARKLGYVRLCRYITEFEHFQKFLCQIARISIPRIEDANLVICPSSSLSRSPLLQIMCAR
jgi:hypothetical protein